MERKEDERDGSKKTGENLVKKEEFERDIDENDDFEGDSDEDLVTDRDVMHMNFKGVGAGGNDKKKKGSSSKKSSKNTTADKPVSTKKFTKEDAEWAKDLPSDFNENHKDCINLLSAPISQGPLQVCWAVAIAKCIQALYAKTGVRVELSPQHLINNIVGKSDKSGHIIKYEELSNLLIHHGIPKEEACPFTGNINENCSKKCSLEKNLFKIKEFNMIEKVKEEEVIALVNQDPVVAIVSAYDSFYRHKSGIYKGREMRKDVALGLHAVLVYGFGTNQEGEHYWLIQNPWGPKWGENGIGKILRQCSYKKGEPSMFVNVIHMKV